MQFFIGLILPADSKHFPRVCLNINRVRNREKPVPSREWLLDSGAFNELEKYGGYRHTAKEYAAEVDRLCSINPGIIAAAAQDWPCSARVLSKTGLTVAEHQRRTIERYDAIVSRVTGTYVIPTIQGLYITDYLSHLEQYGSRLTSGMWVGIG